MKVVSIVVTAQRPTLRFGAYLMGVRSNAVQTAATRHLTLTIGPKMTLINL
jgi:hypothetical protein